ncbi:MAG: beta-galactosidase trimerization domain-containing protein [Planctomycetota bacterium]|nr:beta-galactosidase trimerization domain-containing protein [Planctomycetota bacterium]
MTHRTVMRWLTLLALTFSTHVHGDEKLNPEPGVLWSDDFEALELHTNRHDGWGLGNPPQTSMTVKDGIVSVKEIGDRTYSHAQRYIPFDLVTNGQGFPFLKMKLAEGPGRMGVSNASTGGQGFASNLQGPGLFAIDLRKTSNLPKQKKPGMFALSLVVFGPRGHQPGPVTNIDWMKMTASNADAIEVALVDSQKEGEPGHGYVTLGDKLQLSVDTSTQVEQVTFELVDTRTGKPLKIDGRTSFPAVTDPDRLGRSWQVIVPVSFRSDTKFKTWYERKGKIHSGNTRVMAMAKVTGGPHQRLMGYMPYGFDLTTATKPGGSAKDIKAILEGKVMLEEDFDKPRAQPWRFIAGDQWVFLRGRFGELSDSSGPDGDGVWATGGEDWWSDYRVSADVAEEMDGAGSVYLAVRFQNPKNYYALEWLSSKGDSMRLVRCKDGIRYVISKSDGHKLDKLPFNMSVTVSGDFLVGYLNGQPVVDAYVGDFESGPMAIGEMGRKVLLDNIKVTRVVSEGKKSRFLRHLKFTSEMAPRYFLRDTGEMTIPFKVENTSEKPFEKVYVQVEFSEQVSSEQGKDWSEDEGAIFPSITREFSLLKPGETKPIPFRINTHHVKRGEYVLRTRVTIPREGLVRDEVFPFGIARNWNPERFNYFTWGMPRDEETIRDYVEHGHTMGIGGGRGQPIDWQYRGMPVPDEARPQRMGSSKKGSGRFHPLDLALKYGMLAGTNLQSNNGRHFPEEVYGKDSKGNRTRLPLPYHPRMREFSINFAQTFAKRYGQYPAYQLMNLNTETEYHNHTDYSELGLAKAKKEYGSAPPELATSMFGVAHTKVPGMAENGVIDDGHPLLKFYRWFWLKGEGFNEMAIDMAKAVKEVTPHMITIHDPAVRMPYFRDRHDGINPWDWTYTTPNALAMPYKLEVLRALAEPGNDKICNYVQVLWKGTIMSPENECPSATIIRLGLLHSMSRPVYSVGHWNTGWMRAPENLDRWEGVKRLHKELWKPLGPVFSNLKQDTKREVAFLVSHTNELFAPKFRGGWQKYSAFAAWHEAFLRASLPVDIVFEEDVAEGKLSNYRALFIPFCEVISRAAFEKIDKFARNGGEVIADHNLGFKVPDVKVLATNMDHMVYPNWAWRSVRNNQGVNAKKRLSLMWNTVDELKQTFGEARKKVPTADSEWLVINQREWDGTRYIFAINDKRSAGDQVGQHGVALEQGEPITGTITSPDENETKAVYDLVQHRKIDEKRKGSLLSWEYDYAPASGVLFALLSQEIARMEVKISGEVKKGEKFRIAVRILDAEGKPIHGLIPIRITLRDSQGSVSEYSDTFAVKNGAWQKEGFIASNDRIGTWSVKADDLASGLAVTKYFRVVE